MRELFFPYIRHIDKHDSLPSTNDRAKELLRSDSPPPLPCLVTTKQQTAGRGRGSNSWWSGSGGLTFSLVLEASNPLGKETNELAATKEAISLQELPALSLTTALTVCDTLTHFAPKKRWQIKWPNDVLLADDSPKKIAGILIETINSASHLILGVGINIGNSFVNAPNAIAANGIALSDCVHQTPENEAFLELFLRNFLPRVQQLVQKDKSLWNSWNKHSFLTGKRVTLSLGELDYCGRCLGFDQAGRLLLKNGQEHKHFPSGTIKHYE